ncbi:MAG: hypothetical protein U0736_09780 [Gemmataceae bacterium]
MPYLPMTRTSTVPGTASAGMLRRKWFGLSAGSARKPGRSTCRPVASSRSLPIASTTTVDPAAAAERKQPVEPRLRQLPEGDGGQDSGDHGGEERFHGVSRPARRSDCLH